MAQKAHLILPTHRMLDAASEKSKGHQKIGSTLKGIGPTYMDKTGRNGLRIGDILLPDFESKYRRLKQKHLDLLKLYPSIDFDLDTEESNWMDALESIRALDIVPCEYFINEAIVRNQKILAEGAQGSMLDIDFGTYPFVTSSNTITAGVCTGLGVAPQQINEVIGIMKAYCTRVGSGPFPTELHDDTGEYLRSRGNEFGATTGRPRRCGWLDLPQVSYTCMINGITQIAMTKIDVLNDLAIIEIATGYQLNGQVSRQLPYDLQQPMSIEFKSFEGWQSDINRIRSYDDLPKPATDYCSFIERQLATRISLVSTGPERNSLIVR